MEISSVISHFQQTSMNDLYKQCQEAARIIVQRSSDLYPLCHNAVNIDFNTQNSQGSQSFERKGTSESQKQYTLPGDLGAQLASLYTAPPVDSTTTNLERNLIQGLLQRANSDFSGKSVLQDLENISPSGYAGKSALDNIIARNPYSTDYENQTKQLYERSFDKAHSAAQSGQSNVRGGTARQGFELGELGTGMSQNRFKDITSQQNQEAGIVSQAVQSANVIEGARRNTQQGAVTAHNAIELGRNQQSIDATAPVGRNRQINLQNLMLASEVLGVPRQTQKDDLAGQGQQIQNSQGTNFGLTCCFIFLQALNGVLPWYVRLGRDEFCTPKRRNGYNWMALWLVGWMSRSPFVAHLVNLLMIKPFLHFGTWYYANQRSLGWLYTPIIFFWFLVWDLCGNFNKKGLKPYAMVA